MSLSDIADYLRRNRGLRSDEDLKNELLIQGRSLADVEAAFALAAPTQVFEAPRPPGEATLARQAVARRGRLTALAITLVVLGAVGYGLARLAAYGRGQRRHDQDAAKDLLRRYRPPLLAVPAHLALALPAGLEDADAAPDYARFFGGDAAALEEALGKARCTAVQNGVPDTAEGLLARRATMERGIAAGGEILARRARAAEVSGDKEKAAAAQRRRFLFGWHMMQDYGPFVQRLGLAQAQQAVIALARLAPTGAQPETEARLPYAQLAVELTAYAPLPEELRSIAVSGLTREGLSRLSAYAQDSERTRPYLQAALLSAASGWSAEEIAAAQPWPERAALFDAAARRADPRAASLGKAFGALLESQRAQLAALPPEGRAAAAAAWKLPPLPRD